MSDDNVLLREPDLHDGTLTGIVLNDLKGVTVYCADVDGRQYVLRLAGLVRLCADHFLEGNIIFEVKVHTQKFSSELIRRVYGEDDNSAPEWLPGVMLNLSHGTWTLLEVTSSYGCHLLALAQGHFEVAPQR
jgi:hypothetical protein